jgi:hypothetical protein
VDKLRWYASRLSTNFEGEYRLLRDIFNGEFPSREALKIPTSFLERTFLMLLVFIRSLSLSQFIRVSEDHKTRSQWVEIYVIFCVALSLLFLFGPWANGAIAGLMLYRIVDALNYQLCVIFVDHYKANPALRSSNRSLLLLLVNYIEFAIAFAVLYRCLNVEQDGWSALNLSILTITSIGGTPTSTIWSGKALIDLEAIVGFLFVVLVFTKFVSFDRGSPSRPQ